MNRDSGKKLITVLAVLFFILVIGLGVLIGLFIVKSEKTEETTVVESAAEQTTTDTQIAVSETQPSEVSSAATEVLPADAPVTSETTSSKGEDDPDESKSADELNVDEVISSMSLHEKVCQLFIVTPEQLTGYDVVTQAGDTTKEKLEEYPVGGLIYFAQNMEDYSQVEKMINDTKSYAKGICKAPLFISVDEEGGDVARCADTIGTTKFEPMFTYRDEGPETAFDNAKQIAEDISKLGFNLDFAPVADTWSNPSNTVIGSRAYSDDFSETADLVAEAVKGFSAGGVCCTLKHFPGHGDTAEDSHYFTAISNRTLEQLEAEEYAAFKKGISAGADMVMVGHITVPALDEEPASVSYKVITGELREKLGFKGIIITDSLAMGAVANEYTTYDLASKVFLAGADILLMPDDLPTAVKSIEDGVSEGRIDESRIDESLKRILLLKSKKIS